MKRTPLVRKTPLRAKTRLRPRGPVKGRWDDYRQEQRALVVSRALGRCEACHRRGTAWAHLFGRRNIIGEPYASSAALTMLLCDECHAAYDASTDMPTKIRLGWIGVQRLLALLNDQGFDASGVTITGGPPLQPVDVIKRLARLVPQGPSALTT